MLTNALLIPTFAHAPIRVIILFATLRVSMNQERTTVHVQKDMNLFQKDFAPVSSSFSVLPFLFPLLLFPLSYFLFFYLSSILQEMIFDLDIVECNTNNGDCSDYCYDTPGSYHCGCPSGYQLAVDAKTCEGSFRSLSFFVKSFILFFVLIQIFINIKCAFF